MSIPRGFVEVHPLEEAPFVTSELFKHGAIVKYLRSRETTGTDEKTEFQMVSGFISRTGAGQMVHELSSRGGIGLPFKLLGDPALNARLCAVKEQWVIWLQWAAWTWDVGAAYDLLRLRELQNRMRATDDELDRAILHAGGAFAGDSAMIGIEDVTASPEGAPLSGRAQRRAERLKAPCEQQRARALIRRLLAIGAPSIGDVRREFRANGFTVEQLQRAAEEVAAEVVLVRRQKEPHLRLPTRSMTVPAKVIAKTANMVRKQIDAAWTEADERDRADSRRESDAAANVAPNESGGGGLLPPSGWLGAQLALGARRLADLRREMPAPNDADQLVRDEIFLTLAREAHVLVRAVGPRRQRGFWLELAPGALEPDESFVDAVRAAMAREGSPHIAYPIPRAWF